MPRRAPVIAAALLALACRSEASQRQARDPSPSLAALPEVDGEALGLQPGYVEGGFAYASLRAGLLRELGPRLSLRFGQGDTWRILDEALADLDPATQLSATARALEDGAVHLRIYVPDPAAKQLAHWLAKRGARPCGSTPSAVCLELGASSLASRAVTAGREIDLRIPARSSRQRWPSDSVATVPQLSKRRELAQLRGELAVLIDGPATVAWLAKRSAAQSATGEAVAALHDTERLFAGLTLEAQLRDDELQAQLRWLATPVGLLRLRHVFGLREAEADVPSRAALCDGARLCARTRGLPAPERFVGLATGRYADPQALARTLRDAPELGAAVLMLETWPNAIGSLARVSERDLEGPVALAFDRLRASADRALGFGLSVQSGGAAQGEGWVAYARTPAIDLDGVGRLLGFAGLAPRQTSLAGSPNRVESLSLAHFGFTGRYYAVYEPSAATGDWGWAVLADDEARLRWLLDRPRDDGANPLAYFALSPGHATVPGLPPQLDDLSLRAELRRGPRGSPELRVAVSWPEP